MIITGGNDHQKDTLYSKSKHLKGRLVPCVSTSRFLFTTRDLEIFLFLDTFRIQGILLFLLLEDWMVRRMEE